MTTTIDRKELKRALPTLTAATRRTGALANVTGRLLLESGPDTVTLTATDVDSAARVTLKAHGDTLESCTVDARAFAKIARAGKATTLALESTPVALLVDGVALETESTKATEWPTIDSVAVDAPTVTLDRETLHDTLSRAIPAASTDATRYNLNGVAIDTRDESFQAVATDGHRLHAIVPGNGGLEWPQPAGCTSTILPADLVGLILKATKTTARMGTSVTVRQEGNFVTLECGPITLTGRPIAGEYPNWRAVVPANPSYSVTIERKPTLESIARLRLAWAESKHDRAHVAKLTIVHGDSGHWIHAETATAPAVVTEWPANVPIKPHTERDSFALNLDYLSDALEAMTGTHARIQWTDALSPLRIESDTRDDSCAVVMPVRS